MSIAKWTSASVPYLQPGERGEGESWAQEAAAHGGRGTHRVVEAGVVTPPSEVASLLGEPDATVAVARRRVVYLDDRPVELVDSYYPASIAAGTPLADIRKIRGGAVNLLRSLGYVTASVQEDVSARQPSDFERELFSIDQCEPVLIVTRLIRDEGGRLFQVDIMVTPARFRKYRYDLRID